MTSLEPNARLTPKVYSSIQEIPRASWNALLEHRSCSFSHEFWTLIEQSGLNDFAYRHITFHDETGKAVALASFYSVTTDIAIFATGFLRTLLESVRRPFPNFLKVRMLECGTPITINSPPFVSAVGIPPAAVLAPLHKILLETARKEGQFIIILRDFEPDADGLWPALRGMGYHRVESLPNTHLEIEWATPEDYLGSLKSYYRSKLLRHLRRIEAQQIRCERVEDFRHLADTLCAQWLNVHHQADEFQREVLTPAFYREFSSGMGKRSQALLFYRQDELIGHALLLQDGDMLRWLYIGRKKAENDSLYIYAAHKVVEQAILLGARRLEMGLTTYAIKQDLGAQMTPIRLALRAASGIINPFVGLGYALLNRTPAIRNKDIFKKTAA